MMHLNADRIAELARAKDAPLSTATAAEREHLASCAACRTARARDAVVDRALRAAAWPVPSASFVAAARTRFLAARRAQEVRRRLRVAIGAAVLTALVVVSTLAAGVIAAKQVVLMAALHLKDVVIALDLVSTVTGRSGFAPVLVAIVCTACLALSMGVIARLARAPVAIR